jgi:hypothetical protein
VNPLFAVRERLRAGGAATVSQLAAELRLSPNLVQDLLAHWQRRGQVESLGLGPSGCGSACNSGGCNSCQLPQPSQSGGITVFRWRDSA